MEVSINAGTLNGWFMMENPINMDDLGVTPFSETSICMFTICSPIQVYIQPISTSLDILRYTLIYVVNTSKKTTGHVVVSLWCTVMPHICCIRSFLKIIGGNHWGSTCWFIGAKLSSLNLPFWGTSGVHILTSCLRPMEPDPIGS